MSYGVTKQGFVQKPYDVHYAELSARAKQLFGSNINLSVFGFFGLLIRLMAWAFTLIWQKHEETFYQLWLEDAEGMQVDLIVAFGGLTREGATKSNISLVIEGEDGTTVGKGFIGQTAQKIKFITIEDVTIAGGTATVIAQAVVAGTTGNVAENSVTSIFTPVTGVTGINNPEAAVPGKDRETDDDLKKRYKESRAFGAGSSLPALKALMLQVPGNIEAEVYENTEDTIDADGRPPGCVEAVVYGGVLADYANALFGKRAAGIRAYGSSIYTVIDDNGQQRKTGITFANQRSVYVRLVITKNSEWNDGNITALKTAIVKYIGGNDTVDDITTSYRGLGIGATTFTWKIIAAADALKGIKKIVAFVGFTAPANRPDELPVGIRDIPRTDTSKITVEFV